MLKALRQGQAWDVKEWKVGWRGVEGGWIREVGSASWPNQWRAFSWTVAWAGGNDFQQSLWLSLENGLVGKKKSRDPRGSR